MDTGENKMGLSPGITTAAQATELSAAIRQMFQAQNALQVVFPKRLFTPDGRMVGDIGEAIAEICYRITIDAKVLKDWDGKREEGDAQYPEVQVRATQKDETYLKQPPHDGSLLVFMILPNGKWECCYNGNINRVWGSLDGKKADSTGAKLNQAGCSKKAGQRRRQ